MTQPMIDVVTEDDDRSIKVDVESSAPKNVNFTSRTRLWVCLTRVDFRSTFSMIYSTSNRVVGSTSSGLGLVIGRLA